MPHRFERFMAHRYLRGSDGVRAGSGFLRFVMYVAIGGVALGVAALLLALSIVRGFSREIEAKIVGFGAHVQVENMQDAPLGQANVLMYELAQFPEVAHVAPVVTEFALIRRSATDIDGVAVWGTDQMPAYLTDHLVAGSYRFDPDEQGRQGLVIGRALADLLSVSVGDRLTVFSMRHADGFGPSSPGLMRPRVKAFHVAGIYETSLSNFDEIYAFTDIRTARALFDYAPTEVSRLDLTLHDVSQADSVAVRIEDRYGFPVMARTIYQVYSGLFAWVRLQQGIIPLIIGIIILVAAFNIVGTLLMIILEHTQSIGILASMGAPARMLRRIYLYLGLLVGVIGIGIGEALALVLAWLQLEFALIPLPAEAYYMSTAPVALNPVDFIIVALVTLLLCVGASYLPARAAARIPPIRAIHFR
ncbi:MAG: ABC transporter permease [Bacteroidetes bacterium]|nr:MAG: ABC transporter permease [Bacteroidota bacterium]